MINTVSNPAEPSSLAGAATEEDPSAEEPVLPTQNSILVVDDEVDTRAALSEALGDAGYKVFVAGDGKEGLHIMQRLKKPLGVILDLSMPVMSGIELYSIMKATPALADIPVVISTTDTGRAPKGVPLMKKPVTLEGLLAAVAALF